MEGTQFLELADGSGWIQWARDDPSKRLSLLGMSFEVSASRPPRPNLLLTLFRSFVLHFLKKGSQGLHGCMVA
eukprot:6133712-Amphidinium_carterae.1